MIKLNRIKEVLARQGFTNKKLADETGLNYIMISRYCSNEVQPTIPTLKIISDCIKCKMSDLLLE